jgi:cell division protein FtsB
MIFNERAFPQERSMRRTPVFSIPIAFGTRFLAVSVIVLALPASGPASVCDQILAAEREVEGLRDRVRTLRADVAAKKRRLDNVRAWMPDAGAQQRLTEARAAHDKAKANVPALREERQRIERQRIDTLQQKKELIAEKARRR